MDFGKKGGLDYFIVLPLVTQLQSFLSRTEIPDLIEHPTKRVKQNSENFEDVYDGRLYKTHFGPDGFFKGTDEMAKRNEVHLSLQINTDGVALFRSSKYSIWPVYFPVNELPPKCRQQRKYRMFAGLWFGNKKPHFQTFLQPFVLELKSLFTKGTQVTIKEKDKILRCIVLFGTFDAPAKCLFQEFCQFNAFYGCPYCLNPGVTVKTSAKGHTHAYPFDETNLKTGHGEARTHQQTLEFATAATTKTAEKGVASDVKGVNGLSWFMFVPKFDIIRSVAIDYMHATLLGVVKMFLTLWLDKSYSTKPWSVRKRIGEIETRYMKIMPPSCITRPPRSLIGNFGHLKASELRTFLVFYSIPCLYGILPEEYFQHYILLVEAITILLQQSISLEDLVKASALLKHFCLKIKLLYEPRYETFNVHCLLHLTERVYDLGPLWAQSCFCFEDFSGELRKLFHGTQSVESQIVLAISIQQRIPELVPLLPEGSESKKLYLKLTNGRTSTYMKEEIGECCFAVGTMKKFNMPPTEKAVVETVIGSVSQVKQFQRLLTGDQLIHCKLYKSMTRRNNFTIQYDAQPLGLTCYGQVKYYVKCQLACPNPQFCNQGCVCCKPRYLAVINKLEKDVNLHLAKDKHTGAELSHIIPVMKDTSFTAISVQQITRICVYIDCGSKDTAYIGLFPNQYEKD